MTMDITFLKILNITLLNIWYLENVWLKPGFDNLWSNPWINVIKTSKFGLFPEFWGCLIRMPVQRDEHDFMIVFSKHKCSIAYWRSSLSCGKSSQGKVLYNTPQLIDETLGLKSLGQHTSLPLTGEINPTFWEEWAYHFCFNVSHRCAARIEDRQTALTIKINCYIKNCLW